jgi:hypothetical protein
MAAERRDHPRIQCRLACAVKLDRTRVRGRVLDVSGGGLCILLPERLERGRKLLVTIEVPRIGPIDLETTVWHRRRIRRGPSGKRGWATGLLLDKAGPGYEKLVDLESSPPNSLDDVQEVASDPDLELEVDADEGPSIYRLRVKAVRQTRTKVLSLSADSAEVAREAALSELPGEWVLLEIELQ